MFLLGVWQAPKTQGDKEEHILLSRTPTFVLTARKQMDGVTQLLRFSLIDPCPSYHIHTHVRTTEASIFLPQECKPLHIRMTSMKREGRKTKKWRLESHEWRQHSRDPPLPVTACCHSQCALPPALHFLPSRRCAKFILTQNAWMCLPLWLLHRPGLSCRLALTLAITSPALRAVFLAYPKLNSCWVTVTCMAPIISLMVPFFQFYSYYYYLSFHLDLCILDSLIRF